MLSIRRPRRVTIENIPLSNVNFTEEEQVFFEELREEYYTDYPEEDPFSWVYMDDEELYNWWRGAASNGHISKNGVPIDSGSIIDRTDNRTLAWAEGVGGSIGKTMEWVLEHGDEAIVLYERATGKRAPAPPARPPSTKPSLGVGLPVIAIVGLGIFAYLMLK
jgi:hypothetical protein